MKDSSILLTLLIVIGFLFALYLSLTYTPPQLQQISPSVERSVVCKYRYSNDNPPVFHIRCPA